MAYIVVIDDEQSMRVLMRQILEKAGHEVAEAADGKAGETLIVQRMPDLIVTDLMMPEQEGIETIRKLKRTTPSLRILAISGSMPLEGIVFLGADRVLKKPFRANVFLATVEQLIGRGIA